ncbi:MAG: hypothetical protein WC758_04355 [Candidatus Woesearchaeota archaeon]|jgi:hypothetical protein
MTLILFTCLSSNAVFALEQKDVSINITLLSQINSSTNYSKFILLKNNDDVSAINDNLSMSIFFNLTKNNLLISNWTVQKTINSYSESGFGTINVGVGNYTFCVLVIPLNFDDYIQQNNFLCVNFTAINISNNASNNTSNLEFNNSQNLSYNGSFNINSSDLNFSNSSLNINLTELNESFNLSINLSINVSLNMSVNLSLDINESMNSSMNFSINSSMNSSMNISINESDEYSNNSVNTSNNSNYSEFCNCSLQILTPKNIFTEGEKLEFKIIDCNSSSSFYAHLVEYWISSKDGVVKQKINTTSKSEKSYTPSLKSEQEYFVINSKYVDCQNKSEKLIVFTSNESFSNLETNLEITSYSNNIENIMFVSIEGYKSNIDKTLISIWVESLDEKKVSSVSKVYVNEKNTKFSFKLPITLSIKKSGKYNLIVEGLGEREEEEIDIFVEEEDVEDSKNTQVDFSENALLEKDKQGFENQITSFYTRKKIFSEKGVDEIIVYVNINKIDDSKNTTLIISYYGGFILLTNVSEKNSILINISSKNEIILAELYSKNVLVDSKTLKLNLTIKDDEINESNKTNTKSLYLDGVYSSKEEDDELEEYDEQQDINYLELNHSEFNHSDFNDSELNYSEENSLTGDVVMEDLQEWPNDESKINKSVFVFGAISSVICLILFNKKTRRFILKKTKLFK